MLIFLIILPQITIELEIFYKKCKILKTFLPMDKKI